MTIFVDNVYIYIDPPSLPWRDNDNGLHALGTITCKNNILDNRVKIWHIGISRGVVSQMYPSLFFYNLGREISPTNPLAPAHSTPLIGLDVYWSSVTHFAIRFFQRSIYRNVDRYKEKSMTLPTPLFFIVHNWIHPAGGTRLPFIQWPGVHC